MIYAGRLDASSPDLRRLEEVVEGENLNPDLIDEVVASIRRSGAIEESVAIARVYVERAKMAARVVPDLETSEMLSDIAEFALRRLK